MMGTNSLTTLKFMKVNAFRLLWDDGGPSYTETKDSSSKMVMQIQLLLMKMALRLQTRNLSSHLRLSSYLTEKFQGPQTLIHDSTNSLLKILKKSVREKYFLQSRLEAQTQTPAFLLTLKRLAIFFKENLNGLRVSGAMRGCSSATIIQPPTLEKSEMSC